MTEQEVFDLLDGGWIVKRDWRGYDLPEWEVEIGDAHGDLANCLGSTPEVAWHQAVAHMPAALEDRKHENSEANEPTLSAYERNR